MSTHYLEDHVMYWFTEAIGDPMPNMSMCSQVDLIKNLEILYLKNYPEFPQNIPITVPTICTPTYFMLTPSCSVIGY